jgi:protein-S-isoprenylcysteine O-methyltransferase Ste14
VDTRLRRWFLRQVAFFGFSVGLMFLLAGRLDWLGGWLVTAVLVASQATQWLVVGRRHPDLLVERSGMGQGVDRGDIPYALVLAYGPFLAMLLAGLEIRAQGLPEATVMVYVLGILVVVVGITVTVAAMLANRFFGPVLRIQSDRDHVVVADGPYRVVRHPGYVGAILFYVGLPLLLGSWWSVPVMLVTIAVTIARTAREDGYLRAYLPGYAEYAQRVRWRLLPGLW